MEMNIETISAIALGIGLSASTGFRVFIPLLVAGIASRIGLIPLGEKFCMDGIHACNHQFRCSSYS